MRPELQAKLLQHLSKKRAEGGFTLVELLVVVIIIGILAAIALPSYLNLTASSKQSEGRQNVGSLIRAQQTWATENALFATSFDLLATGVVKGAAREDTTSSTAFDYRMSNTGEVAGVNINGALSTAVGFQAQSKDAKLKGYTGGIDTYINAANQQTWGSSVCEAAQPGIAAPAPVTVAAAPSAEVAFAAAGGGSKAKVAGDILCAGTQNEVKVAGK